MITRKHIIVCKTVSCRRLILSRLIKISWVWNNPGLHGIILEHLNWLKVNLTFISGRRMKVTRENVDKTAKDYARNISWNEITGIVPDGSNPTVKFQVTLNTPLNCHSGYCAFLSRGSKTRNGRTLGHYRRAFSDLMAPTKRHPVSIFTTR